MKRRYAWPCGTSTSQSCSSAGSMNRRAIAIPSSSGMLNRPKFSSPSPVHRERSWIEYPLLEDCACDPRQTRFRNSAALERASGREPAANGRKNNRVKKRRVLGVEGTIDKNRFRGVQRECAFAEKRAPGKIRNQGFESGLRFSGSDSRRLHSSAARSNSSNRSCLSRISGFATSLCFDRRTCRT